MISNSKKQLKQLEDIVEDIEKCKESCPENPKSAAENKVEYWQNIVRILKQSEYDEGSSSIRS